MTKRVGLDESVHQYLLKEMGQLMISTCQSVVIHSDMFTYFS